MALENVNFDQEDTIKSNPVLDALGSLDGLTLDQVNVEIEATEKKLGRLRALKSVLSSGPAKKTGNTPIRGRKKRTETATES